MQSKACKLAVLPAGDSHEAGYGDRAVRTAGRRAARADGAGSRITGLRHHLGARDLRRRLFHSAHLDRRPHRAHQRRQFHHADLGADAGQRRHACRIAGLSLERPADPRHRRIRAAGGRGLVRSALPETPGADARVDCDLPPDRLPRWAGVVRRQSLQAAHAGRHGARQAAEADPASGSRAHTRLPRRGRAEERRLGSRTLRRLDSRCSSPPTG